MTIHFTSDWHFGHVNIMKYCPARPGYLGIAPDASMDEMNEALVRIWNEQVEPDDDVYLIGDFAMGKVAETIHYAERLKGHKYLVMGNHDRPHPIMSKTAEKRENWEAIYEAAGFEDLLIQLTMEFDGVLALVHHFPYEGDHSDEERYTDWRPADAGLPLVHGHLHDQYQTKGRMFNVGIDAWNGRMLSPEEIGAYFRSVGY